MTRGRPGSPRRPNGTFIEDTTHACRGGKPYPKETREEIIALFQNGGLDALTTALAPTLVEKKVHC